MAITKTKAATEAHIRLVRCDPDFRKELNILAPCTKLSAEGLYNKYGIELDDLDCVLTKLLSPYNVFSAGYLRYNNEGHEFVATFSEDIKKEQFDELWVLIQNNREKENIPRTKNKSPQEDDLLYAIFKARMAGMSFFNVCKTDDASSSRKRSRMCAVNSTMHPHGNASLKTS